eukprot:6757803-Prymnesium_polylepis.1
MLGDQRADQRVAQRDVRRGGAVRRRFAFAARGARDAKRMITTPKEKTVVGQFTCHLPEKPQQFGRRQAQEAQRSTSAGPAFAAGLCAAFANSRCRSRRAPRRRPRARRACRLARWAVTSTAYAGDWAARASRAPTSVMTRRSTWPRRSRAA